MSKYLQVYLTECLQLEVFIYLQFSFSFFTLMNNAVQKVFM